MQSVAFFPGNGATSIFDVNHLTGQLPSVTREGTNRQSRVHRIVITNDPKQREAILEYVANCDCLSGDTITLVSTRDMAGEKAADLKRRVFVEIIGESRWQDRFEEIMRLTIQVETRLREKERANFKLSLLFPEAQHLDRISLAC